MNQLSQIFSSNPSYAVNRAAATPYAAGAAQGGGVLDSVQLSPELAEENASDTDAIASLLASLLALLEQGTGAAGAGGGSAAGVEGPSRALSSSTGQEEARSSAAGGGVPEPSHPLRGTHRARGTSYFPSNKGVEGGFKDMKDRPLHTLQDYLAGKAPFVSVAMDDRAGIPYGQHLRIKELEEKYGRRIDFRVVDTGPDFRNKGTSRIDICTANEKTSFDETINGPLTLQFV